MTQTGRASVSCQKPTWSESWKTGSEEVETAQEEHPKLPDPSYPYSLDLCKYEIFQTGNSVRPMVFSVPSSSSRRIQEQQG